MKTDMNTQKKKVRWGIIGCGEVCEQKSGPAFYKCNHSELIAVMRRDAFWAEDFANRHAVRRWYSKAEDLIFDPEVDIVYVATPPSTHASYTIEALKAGKSVYVEKPMAMNYKECEDMIRTAEQMNQNLWTAYYRRSLPYFLKVKNIVDEGLIGQPQTITMEFFRPPSTNDLDKRLQQWRTDRNISGGGYFHDMASHTINIAQYILGNIREVKGFAYNIGRLYEVEDVVSASFLFESDVVGSGIWNYVSSKQGKKDLIEITGKKGLVRLSTFSFAPIELITTSGREIFDPPAPDLLQQPMIQSVVDEFLGKGVCPSDGKSGAHTSWVIDQLSRR